MKRRTDEPDPATAVPDEAERRSVTLASITPTSAPPSDDNAPHDQVDPEAPHWRRECFIPIRKSELVRLLAKQAELSPQERDEFLSVCKVLDATLHFEYQGQLDQLKDVYAAFNPDIDTRTLRQYTPAELEDLSPRVFDAFVFLLNRANYQRLSREEIQNVVGAATDWGVRLQVDFEVFDRLEVFVRGDIVGQRTRRRLRNLYRLETVDVDIYQRLIVVFRLRESGDDSRRARRASSDSPATDARSFHERPVFVKLFKNIPKQDVDMLLPGARIKLTLLDRGKIALPTLSGLVVATIKIVKGAVLAAMFGGITGIIAFTTFVAGTIGYGLKSFFGYLRTKDKYQLNLTKNLYYQNLDNNAGVLFRLLDEAEEQECREAVLAYYLLWRRAGDQGWSQDELDQHAERFLLEQAGLDRVDFETHDAVSKLLRLGIAYQDESGRLHALSADLAIAQLDRSWDSCFQFETTHTPWKRPDHHPPAE
ncbi:MAG: DUF3754 domain-containing protein [Planctomycetales bacterium]|nr:DUF3754 domain-containing protein [Planctomycetales bacterium]